MAAQLQDWNGRKIGEALPQKRWFKKNGQLKESTAALEQHLRSTGVEGIAIDSITVAPTEDQNQYLLETQGGNAAQARRRDQLRSSDHMLGAKSFHILKGALAAGILAQQEARASAKEQLYQLELLQHRPKSGGAIFDQLKHYMSTAKFPINQPEAAETYRGGYLELFNELTEVSQWSLPLQGGAQLLVNDMPPTNDIIKWIQRNSRGAPHFATPEVNKKYRLLMERMAPYHQLGGPEETVTAALDILVDAETDAVDLHEELDAEGAYSFEEQEPTKPKKNKWQNKKIGNKKKNRGGERRDTHDQRRLGSPGAKQCRNLYEADCDFGAKCRFKHLVKPKAPPGPPHKHGRYTPDEAGCSICKTKDHATKRCMLLRRSRAYLTGHGPTRGRMHEAKERKYADLNHQVNALEAEKDILLEALGEEDQFKGKEPEQVQADDEAGDFYGEKTLPHSAHSAPPHPAHSVPPNRMPHRHAPRTQFESLTKIDHTKSQKREKLTQAGSKRGRAQQITTRKGKEPMERGALNEQTDISLTVLAITRLTRANSVILDSGATSSFVINKNSLFNYKPLRTVRTVTDAGGNKHKIYGEGTLALKGRGPEMPLKITKVGYIPTLRVNLLSSCQVRRQGHSIYQPHDATTWIRVHKDQGGHVMTTVPTGGLEWLEILTPRVKGREIATVLGMTRAKGVKLHRPPQSKEDPTGSHAISRANWTKRKWAESGQSPTPLIKHLKKPENKQKEQNGAANTTVLLRQLKQVAKSPQKVTALRIKLAELGAYTAANAHTDEYLKWHDATGHRNPNITAEMARQYGVKLPKTAQIFCHSCAVAKSKRKPRSKKPKHKLELPAFFSQQVDIAGPFEHSQIDGFTYILGAVCRSTRTSRVYGMRSLRDVREVLKRHLLFCKQLQKESAEEMAQWEPKSAPQRTITTSFGAFSPAQNKIHINTDSHSVFVAKATQELFATPGFEIVHTQSPSYAQNQNALIERLFQTLGRTADTMMEARSLPREFWFWAWRHANAWADLTPHEALGGISPYEKRNGARPSTIEHLAHPFGSTVYVHNNARKAKKQDGERGIKGKYIGHHTPSGAHLVLNDSTGRILKSIDVTWDTTLPHKLITGELKLNRERNVKSTYEYFNEEEEDEDQEPEDPEAFYEHHPGASIQDAYDAGGGIIDVGPAVNALLPKHGDVNEYNTVAPTDTLGQLAFPSLTKALNSPDGKPFKEASDKEWKQLFDKGVITEILRSDVHKTQYVHRSSQNFVLKLDEKGQPKKYKSRSCLDGRTLTTGVDHKATDSPCPSHTTIRMLISKAATDGATLYDFDIPGAYLITNRDNVVYASYPHDQKKFRYNPKTNKREEVLLKVTGNWYGAPDGGRQWFTYWVSTLKNLGFAQSKIDPCVFYRGVGQDKIILTSWVDDGLFYAASTRAANVLAEQLNERFGDVGTAPAKFYLGMNIIQFPGQPEKGIFLTHQSMIEKNHKKFKIQAPPADTPLPTRVYISKGDRLKEGEPPIEYKYRQINGYCSYVAMSTRPDVTFATSQLARVQNSPAQKHADLCDRTASYLHHTRTLGVHYKYKTDGLTRAYSDASWQDIPSYCSCPNCNQEPNEEPPRKRAKTSTGETTSDNDSRASSFGGIITMGGGAIWWKSTVSKNKPTCTQESELQAAFHTAKAARPIRWLAHEMGFNTTEPTPLYIDNAGVLATCLRIAVPSKSRHIERQFFNLKEWSAEVHPLKIHTDKNLSDMQTKALARIKHQELRAGVLSQAPSVHDV